MQQFHTQCALGQFIAEGGKRPGRASKSWA